MTGQPRVTNRGFRIYDEFIDTYGHRVAVQESSSAEDPKCWIFIHDSSQGAAHLNVEQAVRVRAALDAFITERGMP